MRNKYIRSVSRNIKVSKRRKKEIISDLEELFELAEKKGESEEQVIERLGEPEMFAMNCVESLLEETEQSNKNKRGVILSMVLICMSLLLMTPFLYLKSVEHPADAIGGVDAATNIYLHNANGLLNEKNLFILGIILLLISIFLLVKKLLSRRR